MRIAATSNQRVQVSGLVARGGAVQISELGMVIGRIFGIIVNDGQGDLAHIRVGLLEVDIHRAIINVGHIEMDCILDETSAVCVGDTGISVHTSNDIPRPGDRIDLQRGPNLCHDRIGVTCGNGRRIHKLGIALGQRIGRHSSP